ncbi:hypothetical protein [Cellvibrio sp. PSBB006]|uniref:hypothetical protein n=1 Tax=Cellvibrio sp. PSBB006 TaxID=1987723 RepID=UPI000B3B353E|nr:hypothetical protein [Cellvibrio sp. PSBB006]ARU28049.1 hypothetical protein CBR65_11770 [Cellvibrio sp. PSBB006]
MKHVHFQGVTSSLQRAEQAVKDFAGEFRQWLRQANWLEILLLCIPVALAITLLPLVLLLFVLCMLARWLMSPANPPEKNGLVVDNNVTDTDDKPQAVNQ